MRTSKLKELIQTNKEIFEDLRGCDNNIFSLIRPGINFGFDTITGSIKTDLSLIDINKLIKIFSRKLNKQRMFLAAIAKYYITNATIGTTIFKQLNRSIKH